MVTIARQFNGPDTSGNGGYVSGMLGARLGAEVATSTLRMPPPLDVTLSWGRDDDGVVLHAADAVVVGTSTPGSFVRDVPAFPSADEAARGLAEYPGFHDHPFDHCFTCGTQRGEGDGLRLFTGFVDDDRVAGAWTPHEAFGPELDVPLMWAALDCPGGWAVDFTRHTVVLGRMTAQVLRPAKAGEPCHAAGVLAERDGRKFLSSTALYTAEGELLGRAEQTWIEIDIAAFR